MSSGFLDLRNALRWRTRRFGEWLAVMEREGRSKRGVAKAVMWGRVILSGLRVGNRVSRGEWRQRMRTCPKCPLYGRKVNPRTGKMEGMRVCRPYDGSVLGCGCFTPFLALVRKPYPRGCWAREYLPGSGLGWE